MTGVVIGAWEAGGDGEAVVTYRVQRIIAIHPPLPRSAGTPPRVRKLFKIPPIRYRERHAAF
jgi:hypothetical protein